MPMTDLTPLLLHLRANRPRASGGSGPREQQLALDLGPQAEPVPVPPPAALEPTLEACRNAFLETVRIRLQRRPELVVEFQGPDRALRELAEGGLPDSLPPAVVEQYIENRRGGVADLSFLLTRAVESVSEIQSALDWAPLMLPGAARAACCLCARLLGQLGQSPEAVIRDPGAMAAAGETDEQPFRMGAQAARLVKSSADRAIERLRYHAARHYSRNGEHPQCVRFRAEGGGVVVEWMMANEVRRREPAADFADSLLRQFGSEFLEGVASSASRKQRCERNIDPQMQALAPGMANAVRMARGGQRPVGVHVCTARTPRGNVPLDVWIYLVPANGPRTQCAAVLTVYRAHREFILESAERQLFYFPPCLLAARISCESKGPRLLSPAIRQPAGGYAWRHPYSGDLGSVLFSNALLLQQEQIPMYEPSDAARAMFPGLQIPTTTPLENTLCLTGQEYEIMRVQQGLRESLGAGTEPDVLGAVTALHDLLRLGLTRAHERNMATPRAHLQAEQMLYPIAVGLNALPGTLAERVFPFQV